MTAGFGIGCETVSPASTDDGRAMSLWSLNLQQYLHVTNTTFSRIFLNVVKVITINKCMMMLVSTLIQQPR